MEIRAMRDIKDDLKDFISGYLETIASPLFLKRAIDVIEESGRDKVSLFAASDKVSRMTALFIDTDLAERMLKNLKFRIEKAA
jgi:hypothetical protein